MLDEVAKNQADGGDAHIDYSDIPALSGKQLAEFKRTPKRLVAVRLDADVLEWIRQFGAGYSTRINHILRAVMSQQQR
ncbi:MAG: 3-oxoacyl-ACP synthase [Acidobacteria bacterium]|nr:3-oxoacyl-ACP synthase [Acidobacteriota bacterium]